MKSSRFAELVALLGFFIGGVISSNSKGGLFQFGALISVSSLVWYFKWGNKLSGWIGLTDAEMQGKIKQIEREIEVVAAAPAGPDRYKKEAELLNKKMVLESKQRELRAATSELAPTTGTVEIPKVEFIRAKAVEFAPTQDPSYTFAIDLMKGTRGYLAIFRKGTFAQQTAKLNQIMGHMDELKTIDTWFENLKSMTADERAPLRARAEKTSARKVEMLTQIFKPL